MLRLLIMSSRSELKKCSLCWGEEGHPLCDVPSLRRPLQQNEYAAP